MALNVSEIEKAKKILSKLNFYTKRLSDINQLIDLVEEDKNFYSFLTETNYGMGLYEKLMEMIELVYNDLYSQLDSLNIHTYNYLNRLYEESVNIKK